MGPRPGQVHSDFQTFRLTACNAHALIVLTYTVFLYVSEYVFPSCLIICIRIGFDVHICRARPWHLMNANSCFMFWDWMSAVSLYNRTHNLFPNTSLDRKKYHSFFAGLLNLFLIYFIFVSPLFFPHLRQTWGCFRNRFLNFLAPSSMSIGLVTKYLHLMALLPTLQRGKCVGDRVSSKKKLPLLAITAKCVMMISE